MKRNMNVIQNIRLSTPIDRPFSNMLDWAVFVFVLLVGSVFAYYVNTLGITLVLVDQFSHLSIARQITDSLTPGMSQVGFWPPLLHILLAPFAAIDTLYYSGYASAVLLIPFLGVAVVLLARLLYLLTQERLLSYLFALLLLANPYMLYFSVTPMMEVLFLAMLIGATYFFARWWVTGELTSLIWIAVFISLATLARFEGFILLPLVTGLVLMRLWRQGLHRSQIEALMLIFGVVALTGVLFTFVYGFVYNDDPLAFMSNNWGAYAQQRDLELPAQGNLINATIYMGAAAKEMLGLAPLATILVGFVFLLVTLIERRLLIFSVIGILLSPFLFDILAGYQGSAVIYMPYLPPYADGFFNARYGLFLAAAAVVIPAIAAALIARTFYDAKNALPVHLLPALYVFIFVAVSIGTFATTAACSTCFTVVQNSQQASPPDHAPAAAALSEAYDGGYILMTRALHNEVAVRAGIPLRNYILEANEHYYNRAVETPWWYARYVVMFNPNERVHQPWQRENEHISKMWADSDEFERFYEQIYISDAEAVYKLRESVLQEHVLARSIPADAVPALQNGTPRWDVEGTHAQIEAALGRWRTQRSSVGLAPIRMNRLSI